MFRALSVLLKLAPLFCLFAAQQSMAAVAVASLDWSQLQVSVFAIPGQSLPAVTYFGQTTQLTADSATAGDSSDSRTHTLFNWTAPFSITSDTPGAHGEVQASAETLSASASSSSVPGIPHVPTGHQGQRERNPDGKLWIGCAGGIGLQHSLFHVGHRNGLFQLQ